MDLGHITCHMHQTFGTQGLSLEHKGVTRRLLLGVSFAVCQAPQQSQPEISQCNGKTHGCKSQQRSPDVPLDWWNEGAGRSLATHPVVLVPVYALTAYTVRAEHRAVKIASDLDAYSAA